MSEPLTSRFVTKATCTHLRHKGMYVFADEAPGMAPADAIEPYQKALAIEKTPNALAGLALGGDLRHLGLDGGEVLLGL